MTKLITFILKHSVEILLSLTLLLILATCTENQRARQYGGSETIELPKGQRLIHAAWKHPADLWYLTEPMPTDYTPSTKVFQEKSNFGVLEGTITFIETR